MQIMDSENSFISSFFIHFTIFINCRYERYQMRWNYFIAEYFNPYNIKKKETLL